MHITDWKVSYIFFPISQVSMIPSQNYTWWRHQMEIFFALSEGNPPVIGGFPLQRPAKDGCDVFFDVCLNKQ